MIDAPLYTRLCAALASTAGSRVYPMVAPEAFTAPLCIYNSLGQEVEHYLGGGASDLLHTRMQIDVYAATAAAAKTMARAVRVSMKTWTEPQAIFVEDAGTDLIEDTVQPHLYRVSMRFIISHFDI
jgi:hypothetical protein